MGRQRRVHIGCGQDRDGGTEKPILHRLSHKQFLVEQCQSLSFRECQFRMRAREKRNFIQLSVNNHFVYIVEF